MIATGMNGDVPRLSSCAWITETHFKTKCKQALRLSLRMSLLTKPWLLLSLGQLTLVQNLQQKAQPKPIQYPYIKPSAHQTFPHQQ